MTLAVAASFAPVRRAPDEAPGFGGRAQSRPGTDRPLFCFSVALGPALHGEVAGSHCRSGWKNVAFAELREGRPLSTALACLRSASAVKGALRGEKDAPTALSAPQDQLQVVTWAAEQECRLTRVYAARGIQVSQGPRPNVNVKVN